MLVADTTAPRKQRHIVRRILARLVEEQGARELSYSMVRYYVRVRRVEIDVEAGRRVEVFIPQQRLLGQEAEVDFGEVWVMLGGVKPAAICSCSGSLILVDQFIVFIRQRGRERSWKDISKHTMRSVVSRPVISGTTI